MNHLPPPSSGSAEQGDDEGLGGFLAGQDPVDVAAANWLVRRQDGLDDAEQAEYQSWLRSDERHARALADLEEIWGRLDALPEDDVEAFRTGLPQYEQAWPVAAPRDLFPASNRQPGGAGAGTQPRPARQPGHRSSWVEALVLLIPRLAAAVFMLSLLGAGWLGWQSWAARPTFVQAYQTERGQHRKIDLPDGSHLWLDAASRAEVAFYRKRREVVLPHGQAMFTVSASAEKPFKVVAGPLRVTVIGTRFSVRNDLTANPDGSTGGIIRVAVEQGHVRVARQHGEGDDGAGRPARHPGGEALLMDLVAGQSLTANAQGEVSGIGTAVADAAPWRQGRVVFDGATLAQALAEFERYGSTHLVIRDPEVAALGIHGSYSLQGLKAFAEALPQVLPVQLVPRGNGEMEVVMRR